MLNPLAKSCKAEEHSVISHEPTINLSRSVSPIVVQLERSIAFLSARELRARDVPGRMFLEYRGVLDTVVTGDDAIRRDYFMATIELDNGCFSGRIACAVASLKSLGVCAKIALHVPLYRGCTFDLLTHTHPHSLVISSAGHADVTAVYLISCPNTASAARARAVTWWLRYTAAANHRVIVSVRLTSHSSCSITGSSVSKLQELSSTNTQYCNYFEPHTVCPIVCHILSCSGDGSVLGLFLPIVASDSATPRSLTAAPYVGQAAPSPRSAAPGLTEHLELTLLCEWAGRARFAEVGRGAQYSHHSTSQSDIRRSGNCLTPSR
ncbi:hypothetical protein J6590_028014 [Homalodisca vitripennis]|nr:hypothetical protein J6590_028014 [Homalodisca vitripennis]